MTDDEIPLGPVVREPAADLMDGLTLHDLGIKQCPPQQLFCYRRAVETVAEEAGVAKRTKRAGDLLRDVEAQVDALRGIFWVTSFLLHTSLNFSATCLRVTEKTMPCELIRPIAPHRRQMRSAGRAARGTLGSMAGSGSDQE